MNPNEPKSETQKSEAYKRRLERNRQWKAMNKDKMSESYRARSSEIYLDPEKREQRKVRAAEYRKNNPDKIRLYDSLRDPIKTRARRTVRNRIYRGTMTKGNCEVCGDTNTHAHHDDYSKPLEVRWLCAKHHAEEHLKAD